MKTLALKLEALAQRLWLMFSIGRIQRAAEVHSVATPVTLSSGEALTLPRIELYGLSHQPSSGRFAAFFPGGSRGGGFGFCLSEGAPEFLSLLSDEVALYNRQARMVKLGASGVLIQSDAKVPPASSEFEVLIQGSKAWVSLGGSGVKVVMGGQSVELSEGLVKVSAGKIQLEGDLEVSGSVRAAGVSDASGSLGALRSQFSSHTHLSQGSPTSAPVLNG